MKNWIDPAALSDETGERGAWIYEHKEIENEQGEDFYFQLIDIDYRSMLAPERLKDVMYARFPAAELETGRIKALLRQAIEWGEDIDKVMKRLDREWLKGGYRFLIFTLLYEEYDPNFNERSPEEFKDYMISCLKETLEELENGTIRITGIGEYEYLELPADPEE